MGILFDKSPEPEVEEKKDKPFTLVLEKYKKVVVVNSIKVDDDDECVLHIEFDHDITDAPEGEVADEVGRIILEKLEESLGADGEVEKADPDK